MRLNQWTKGLLPVSQQRTDNLTYLPSDPVGEVIQIAPGRRGRVAITIRSTNFVQLVVNTDPSLVAQSIGWRIQVGDTLTLLRNDIGGAIENGWYGAEIAFAPADYSVTDIFQL